jgi:hypothetical protein
MKLPVVVAFALLASSSQAFNVHQTVFQTRRSQHCEVRLYGAYEDYIESLKKMSSTEPASDNSGRPVFPTYNGAQKVTEEGDGRPVFPTYNGAQKVTEEGDGRPVFPKFNAPEQTKNEATSSASVVSSNQRPSQQQPAPSIPLSGGIVPSHLEAITTKTTTSKKSDAYSSGPPLPSSVVSNTIDNAETINPLVRNDDEDSFRVPSPQEEVTSVTILDTVGMTERIMKRTAAEAQVTGAGGVSTWEAFLKTEENWSRLKASKPFKSENAPQFVTSDVALGNPKCWAKLREHAATKKLDYDVIVCGGTLGIFFATALQLKGHRVCVLEAGKLRGREQEWNISMDELLELVKLGVLSQADVDAAVKTEFPACRSGFKVRTIAG